MPQLIEYAGHHPWLVTLTLIAALVVLAYELWMRAQNVAALAPQDVIRLMNQGAVLFDLRTAEAYGAGHISGARHLPPEQIAAAGDSLKKYKEKNIVVYCDRGQSAASAVRQLAAQGFSKVFNLRGGIAAWRSENLPLARD